MGEGFLHSQNRMAKTIQRALRNGDLYLFILPALLYIIFYCYVPLYGAQIAFRDYRVADGIWNSAWVGLKHF